MSGELIYLLFFLVSFGASTVGAVCGIGGGVIIKPVLDAFGVLSVSTISFLSGCTVLAMSCYSVVKGRLLGSGTVDLKVGTPLGIGAAVGGIAGKYMFQAVSAWFSDQNMVGGVQAACLLVITLGTLVYTIKKQAIRTYHVQNLVVCLGIGLFLGILSSFLGIGGGPVNLVVLFFFFSMDTKTAANNSLYIILLSQITSLLSTLATKTVPEFSLPMLVLMVAGGILGGISGRLINQKISEQKVDKLFVGLMLVIIAINLFNLFKFTC